MGQDALIELQKTLDEIAEELAFEATQAAKHAGRKTVSAEDIWLVSGKQKA
jgi:histone H3/H4